MVPVPQVASWEALKLFLLEASRNDEQLLIGGRAQTVGARMNLGREHLQAPRSRNLASTPSPFQTVIHSPALRFKTPY